MVGKNCLKIRLLVLFTLLWGTGIQTSEAPASGLKESFGCDYLGCRSHFATIAELTAHKFMHAATAWAFTCVYPGCSRKFTRRADLEKHKKAHGQFLCEFPGCTKTFKAKKELTAHKKSHSEIRLFKCEYPGCSECFKSACKLKVHLAVHSGKKDFKCNFPGCRKAYPYLSSLIRHCKICSCNPEKSAPCVQQEVYFQTRIKQYEGEEGAVGEPQLKRARLHEADSPYLQAYALGQGQEFTEIHASECEELLLSLQQASTLHYLVFHDEPILTGFWH
jgi:hypothetical protein